MFSAEQDVCQTQLSLTSGFLNLGLRSFLRFPALGRTHWLVPSLSLLRVGRKGAASQRPTARVRLVASGTPEGARELLRTHYRGVAGSNLRDGSGVMGNTILARSGENHTKQQNVWAPLPQPLKRSLCTEAKSHALLSDQTGDLLRF